MGGDDNCVRRGWGGDDNCVRRGRWGGGGIIIV